MTGVLSERLESLAVAVKFLLPSHRDPERFHSDKSEIVAELYRLAAEARQAVKH